MGVLIATALIANSSILGLLIPPSVTMIVYGIATETSIGRLFLAGVIPGLLLVGLFMAWSIYSTWRQGGAQSCAGYSVRLILGLFGSASGSRSG